MAEENDANQEENSESSSEENIQFITDDEGLQSTVEFETVETSQDEKDGDDDNGKEESETDESNADDAAKNTSESESSDTKDFHEHPRFQELIKNQNDSKQEIADLKAQIADGKKSTEAELTIDWSNEEAISTAILENPKVALTEMFQQFNTERDRLQGVKSQKLTQEQQTKSEKDTITKYFTETDGALAMWEDKSISKYMDEHPGETAISSHRALTEDSRTKSAVDTALEEAKKTWIKELKSKGNAESLASTGGAPKQIDSHDDELRNPQKHGGRKNVMVNRFKRFLSAS